MSAVVLTPRAALEMPLEAPGIRPELFAELSGREIADLPLWHGKRRVPLGEVFDVQGGRSAEVRIAGDAGRVKQLGAGMTGGSLTVEGDAGMHAGACMTGGTLRIQGDADDWAGSEMEGGVLEIQGDAGDHLAAGYAGSTHGMRGGMVVLHGSAGVQAGESMRRGLIAIAGDAGDRAGIHLIAGPVLVCGSAGRYAGAGMKRGSLVVGGAAELLPTFRYAATYRPDWLRMYLLRLRHEHGFAVPERMLAGPYRRFNGDFTELGKGEVLQWTEG